MVIRSKFRCAQVLESKDANGQVTAQIVTLYPVTGGSGEDKAFWEATPSGKHEVTITNKATFDHYVSGRCYYFDSIPVDE